MWNLDNTVPAIIEAEFWSSLPAEFGPPRPYDWSDANKFGGAVASFLEGPSFDRQGNLYVTDIPFGRIFRISPAGMWHLVAQHADRRRQLVESRRLPRFFGASKSDGMALDSDNNLVVAQASLGYALVLNRRGEVTHIVKSPAGSTLTNLAYAPNGNCLYLTESASGSVLRARMPTCGCALFSHR